MIHVDFDAYTSNQTEILAIQSAAEGYQHRRLYEQLKIIKEFKSGRSGARVFEAHWVDQTGQGLPTIIKLDKMERLAEEIAFSATLKEHSSFLPVIAHSSREETHGCIFYSHACAQQPGTLESLEGLCRQCFEDETGSPDDLLRIIRDSLRCLDLQLRRGGASYQPVQFSKILDYYLRIWYPTMVLSVHDVKRKGSNLEFLLIDGGKTEDLATSCFEWAPNWYQRRIGFPVPGDALYLDDQIWLNIEGRASFQIEDLAVERVKQHLKKGSLPTLINISGKIEDTRLRFYGRVFKSLGFDCDALCLTVAGLSFVNPLPLLNQRLVAWQALEPKMQVAPGHGDLHAGNVLCVGGKPFFIDHAHHSDCLPLWADAARLIGCLWCNVLMPFLTGDEQAQVLDAAFRNRDKVLVGKPARIASFLRGIVDASIDTHGDKATAKTRDLWINLHHFAWVTVKWEGEQAKHPGRVLLAALAGEMAEAAMGRLSAGLPDTRMKIEEGRPEPTGEVASEIPFSSRIRSEIVEIFSKEGMHHFLKPLYRRFGGEGTPGDLTETLSHLVMQKTVPSVLGCLARVFADSDLPKTRQAWKDGESIVGWRILGDVNASSCIAMKNGDKFTVPLETLLGVEIVLSWHGYRVVAVEQRGGKLVGATCLPDFVEGGPEDTDFVLEVAKELYTLMKLKTSEDDLCSMVDGALATACAKGTPYYYVADLSNKHHPLNIPSVSEELHKRLKNLTVVYLERNSATEVSLLIEGEAHLAGAISMYLEEKNKWFRDHP